MRGLKSAPSDFIALDKSSHPSRVRGLKFSLDLWIAQAKLVAPFTGAWIEIINIRKGEQRLEKNLKEKLLFLKANCKPYEINEYFAVEFADDYDVFAQDKNNIETLEYLNDEFIDIDVDYSHSSAFDSKVRETIDEAINMLS